MALATVYCRAENGMQAPEVAAEVHVANGLPGLTIVGMVETAVRESRERVKAAILEAGLDFPARRITVSLAPADLPKAGSRFDLAIAIGILVATRQVAADSLDTYEFYGELALSGGLRPVPALLPALVAARQAGRCCVVPEAAAAEAGLLTNARTLTAAHLLQVVQFLRGDAVLPEAPAADRPGNPEERAELGRVRGQFRARRALEIAAAGGHHSLLVGTPGAGKTMLAKCLPGLLPPLDDAAAVETAVLRSLAGLPLNGFDRFPPWRAPHHTASAPSLVGGGRNPRPGEISLAHRGVLFLDELPEFPRPALEALREPLESGRVTIARASGSLTFPASFQLIAAMNPCPCGFHGDARIECRCGPDQLARYQSRVSGPLLDRIDLVVELRREFQPFGEPGRRAETSAEVRDRVLAARQVQESRQGCINAALEGQALDQAGESDAAADALLSTAGERLALSMRARDRAIRVARSIADLAGERRIGADHMAEALSYRPGPGRSTAFA